MTTYSIPRTDTFAPETRIFATLTQTVHSWAVAILRAHEHRQAARKLRALDDRLLRDIGICRSEIDAAVRGRLTSHR